MRFYLLSLLLLTVGCSNPIGPTITVPHTEPLNLAGARTRYLDKQVKVENFVDQRADDVIVHFGEDKTRFVGSVTGVVQDQIMQLIKGKGLTISDKAKVSLVGQVKQWNADVTPGISGEVNAFATIAIEVKDSSGKKIYTGNYQGSSFIDNANIAEEDFRTALGAAMLEAVEQVGADDDLFDLIASY